MRAAVLLVAVGLAWPAAAAAAAQGGGDDRSMWVGLAKAGYPVPPGRSAIEVLLDANRLLGSTDPVLRDDVAFGAAERWIRDGKITPPDLRRLLKLWISNTADGLGTSGDDRVFKRSFSALCLSLIAARDLAEPFLEKDEVSSFFDVMLDYFQREADLRGFDPVRGWMHTVAHTSDTLKFLARNPKLPAGSDVRLLGAVQAKIESASTVFSWGENDRMALAVQSAVRRSDADGAALTRWLDHWVGQHKTLWAGGPHVDPRQFALVENAKQVLRSLHTALAMEAKPTPAGDSARQAVLSVLSKTR
jgi:hypothetical protein